MKRLALDSLTSGKPPEIIGPAAAPQEVLICPATLPPYLLKIEEDVGQ
jgi:hypothetical protein